MVELGAAIDAAAKYQTEYRTLLLNGEIRWLAGRGQVMLDADGRPARAIGTITDITERKELEEKLRYATESLNIAQTAAGLATFDFNFGRNTRICSDNFHTLLGIPPSTQLDDLNLLLSRVHPDDVARSRSAPIETTPEEPSYRCEYRVLLDGGGERWIAEKATVSRGKSGEVLRITGAIVDITDLKRTEAALDSIESRLERAVRGTQDGLWEIDLVTDMPWFGLRFEEMLGYSVGELSASRDVFQALMHPEDREKLISCSRESPATIAPSTTSNFARGTRPDTTNGCARARRPNAPRTARRCAWPVPRSSSPTASSPSRPPSTPSSPPKPPTAPRAISSPTSATKSARP